jgi:voltage-gated potassium channel
MVDRHDAGRSAASSSNGRFRRLLTAHNLHLALGATVVVIVVGAILELLVERNAAHSTIHTLGQSLWWSVVTMTTVGYGNQYPVTPAGQGIAVIMMFVGIATFGIATASIASFFVNQDNSDASHDASDLEARIERIERMVEQLHQRVIASGPGASATEGQDGLSEPT